jgi:NAD(P)-dependent dehydrogenase (short-subunit alcohol dehydrogenase family)
MDSFDGRVAVITGAASGIGRGLALALAREGAVVVLVDRADPAEAEADCLAVGARTMAATLDVTNRAALVALARDVVARFGKVNLLCNNAGIVAFGPSTEVSEETWDRILAVNVKGVANGIAAFVPVILETANGDGYVVNTASGAGLLAGGPLPLAAYTASKHAVVGLSDTLRAELAGTGIGVSTLCPGSVRTGILDTADYSTSTVALKPAATGAPTPGREAVRRTEPADVARLVLAGIRAGTPYILTHPEARQAIEARYREILASVDAAEALLA